MKKILMMCAVVLATMGAFAADPLPRGGPYTEMVDGIRWTFMVDASLNASVGTGSSSGTAVWGMTKGAIAIPTTLGGRTVMTIGDYAFYDCYNLSSVTIPSGVTSIGRYAFESCSGLTSVTIPSSVSSIGSSAFLRCSGLLSINVDVANDAYSSQDGVLFDKSKATLIQYPGGKQGTYSIPSTVTSIEWRAFWDCYALTGVMIPASVTSIEGVAFLRCSGLQFIDVDVANDTYSSQGGVLFDRSKATLVQYPGGKQGAYSIPSTVTNIGYMAFTACSGLTSVTIPGSVISVGSSVFYECWGLNSVTMLEGVMSIGASAFSECSNLRTVTIPSSVTSIGSSAFSNCSSLNAVNFEGAPPNGLYYAFIKQDAQIRYNIAYRAEWADVAKSCGWTNAKPYRPAPLPEGGPYHETVDGIEWTFMVTNGSASVGTGSYEGARAVQSPTPGYVVIPKMLGRQSVAAVGDYAFYGISDMWSVTIPACVTNVGLSAFGNCENLYSVDFEGAPPKGVEGAEIKQDAEIRYNETFEAEWLPVIQTCGWTNATPYDPYPTEGGPYTEKVDGLVWTFMVDANLNASVGAGWSGPAVPSSTQGDLEIPTVLGGRAVTSIGECAFSGCGGLTSVTIPSCITSIGRMAFGYCYGLQSIYVDPANEYFSSQDGVLFDKYGGTLVQYPGGRKGSYDILSGTWDVGDLAFAYCYDLTRVTLPEGLSSIGMGAFADCTGLESIVIPSSVWTVGGGAFWNCYKLADATVPGWKCEIEFANVTNLVISEGTTDIRDQAFSYCTSLTSVTIPSSVMSIGAQAFCNCSGLTSVTIPESVTSIGDGAFYDCSNLQSINVDGASDTYASQDGVLFDKAMTMLIQCPGGKVGSCTIPSSVTSIGSQAFYNCYGLESIDFEGAPPSGVESAGIMTYAAIRYNGMYFAQWEQVIKQCGWTNAKPYAPYPFQEGGPYKEAVDGIEWTFMVTNGEASVGTGSSESTAISTSTKGAIVIPSPLGGRRVTSIGNYAFNSCNELTGLAIPSRVTSIGDGAFCDCSGLTNVTIQPSVTNIGSCAFLRCSGLNTVDFEGAPPQGVAGAEIKQDAAIRYCGRYFYTWESVIEQCGWTNATPYNPSGEPYPDGGLYAEMVDGLRWLFMVRNLEASLGISTSMYGRPTIPQETTGDIVIPNSLGGRNVTDISGAAFYVCTNLISVTISSIVTNVEAGAFEKCSSLRAINVASGNTHLASCEGVLFNNSMTALIAYPGGLVGYYTIPTGVTNVYARAFSSCEGLEKVTIPSSVLSIGSWAFSCCASLEAVDFEGAPPSGVKDASIKQDAAIRYNIDYRLEWEPVVKACGWTNAKPYTPRLAECWRVSYDLAGGDFVTEDQDWHLKSVRTVAGASSNEEFRLKLVVGEAPVREGYYFLGWTNLVHGSEVFQPKNTYLLSFASEEEFYPLTALWQAKELPTVSPTTSWDDTIQWYKVLGGQAKEPQGERDVTIANAAFKMSYAPVCQDPTNAMIVLVRIKAPSFIRNAEQASAVQFNVDGEYFEQGATSPIGYSYPRVLFHAKEKGDPREYYYIEWYAYVRPGEMSRALAENEVGHAFGETKLYCNWNGDVTYDAIYAIKFDADSCKLYRDTKMVFPLVQQLVWHKGFDPSETKSDVSRASWDHILAYEYYENTIDLASLDGVNDLVRTGYTQQAWVPEVTRGYAVLMKDLTLVTNVVEVTAQWSTNSYDAVLVLGKPGVTIDEEYEIPEDWTVEELPFALPTPEQVISERQVWGLGYWTNQFGKAVTQIDLESVGTNEVDEIPFGAVMTGIVYKVDYIMTNDFANIDKPGTPYQSVNENIMQYSAETNGGNAVFLKDASCFGCKFEGWETKIKTPTGDKWIPASSFSTIRGGDKLFRAKWTEYQAMVVEHDTNTTNYFAVVADAIKAVTNSNTTIAFLDAKGDGVQDPVQIKIPAELKNIAVNFCMLSYTNATGEAALDIGDNAEVRVENLPGFIGLEGYSMSRLVQTNGTYAVRVGEGATFTLDDKNIVLDVDDREEWARAQWVYRNAAAIYAPESATLVLRAGNIGSTAAGTSRDAAAICWEGHDQYLASDGLNFATKPHQDRVEGWSQVAAGYIWTTNGVEGAEFPYTVAKIGEVSPIYTDVRPGDRLTTRGSHVKGVFWADGDAVTNGLFTIQNPTGVIPINDTVVDTVPVEGEPILVHEVGTGLFSIGYADFTDGFINMLVETMEANAAVRISASYDWDGVAGNDDTGTNAKTYVLSYNAVQEGDIVVSNATEQLFPKVGKITYEQEIPVIETNRLVATYTIYDTIHAPGLVLEPAIGWCTNVQGKTYRFDGWHEDDELVTNLVHEVGVGQDVRDRVLRAVFTKVSWDVLDLEGTVVGKAATVQEAVDMIPDGGTIRFFGKQDEATLNEPIVVSSENYGSIYTIDLNGESFTNAPTFKGEYLFEIVGPCLDVTIQNGTIGFEADMPSNDQTGPGGVRASDDAKVTLAKTLTIKTDNTMVCAEDGSLVTLNGAQLANRGKDAGVTAFDEATLVFTNMTYENTTYAANAEIRVYNSLLAPDIKGEIGDTITAIYALDGAEVYLGLNARIANAGDLQTILLRNAKLTVNDPTGNPDSPTISNEKGDAIFTTWGADESCDFAEIDLVRGFILANSSAIQIHAGKLTATNVTAGVEAVRAVTYGSTISIDNDLHILEPEDIRLWNGMYQSLYGDAILSRNTNQGEREYYLKFFLDCAMERTGEGIETITKGALFSYTFRTQYLASGYRVCTDDECIEESGNFWYFIKTIPYAISYELDGGEWKSGASLPPTVYDVEMSGNGYMDLDLTQYVPDREGFYFGGWTNAAGQLVTIVPVGTTGDLSFYATWEVLQPIVPGEKIVVPEGKAEAKAAEINGNPAVKALYLKSPGGIETTEEYRECFNAVATSGSTVEFTLSEKGTNEVTKATTAVKTSVLEVVFSEGSTLTIDEPLVGFYYSLRQGGDLSVGAKADLNKLGGRDVISFELTKGSFQYFYQTLVTPTPQK